jgi:hypothetical protein
VKHQTDSQDRSNGPGAQGTADPKRSDAHESHDDHGPLSFFQILGSTLAAAFGVQSSRNRERDFSRGKVSHFIVAGIVFTTVFVLAVVFVVRLVLSSAGA